MGELKERKGIDALEYNIMAAKLVSDAVRTTLGPKGMDKLIVKDDYCIVTNDGATVLKELDIENPTARMIAETSLMQENAVGDGTTSAVILVGELLEKAGFLIKKGVHPTTIIRGYKIAMEEALKILKAISIPVKKYNYKAMMDIAKTAMTGKGVDSTKKFLAELLIKAVRILKDDININIIAVPGKSVNESFLVDGIALEKKKIPVSSPSTIYNPKIALLSESVELAETDAKININSAEEMQRFIEMEEDSINEVVKNIIDTGANVVFSQKGIDDTAAHIFAEHNIMSFRRLTKRQMELIAKATGARISRISELNAEKLGHAGKIRTSKDITFIEGCKNPMALTLIITGTTSHLSEEIKRAVEDAVGDLTALLRSRRIVAGAGASEIELYCRLIKFSDSYSGKEQVVIRAFAEAMRIIPETLAENSGLDTLEIISKLVSLHNTGNYEAGIDVYRRNILNALKHGIIEPFDVKINAVKSATEVALMILRIDDIITIPKTINKERVI